MHMKKDHTKTNDTVARARRTNSQGQTVAFTVVLTLVISFIGALFTGGLTVFGAPQPSVTDFATTFADDTLFQKNVVAAPKNVVVAVDLQPVHSPEGIYYVLSLGAMSRGDEASVIRFHSGQMYDFVISKDGREVWRWSTGRMFHQAFHSRTIEPGQLLIFTEIWDGRTKSGQPVAGEITITATFNTSPAIEAVKTLTVGASD